MKNTNPKLSILMPVMNMEKYVAETIETILAQTYKNWELVVMDGQSKDRTFDILKAYAAKDGRIKVFSESDEGPWHAIMKAADRARGEFMGMMCASDGYLSNEWFGKAMRVFDREKDVSLVWGIPFSLYEDGKLEPHFIYSHFLKDGSFSHRRILFKELLKRVNLFHPIRFLKKIRLGNLNLVKEGLRKVEPPQKEEWFFYWLKTGSFFPDANMIVARKAFFECTPSYKEGSRTPDAFADFYFNFNSKGYLSYGLPIPANFGRTHGGQFSEAARSFHDVQKNLYSKRIEDFKRNTLRRLDEFTFVNREGKPVYSVKLP